MTSKTRRSKAKTALLAVLWIILVLAALFILLIVPNGLSLRQSFSSPALGDWAAVSPAAWMAELEDDTQLSDISMAGTHDSGTEYSLLPLIARCQDSGIRAQLDMGARALDIRLNSKTAGGGAISLDISHGFVPSKAGWFVLSRDLSFSDVLDDCYTFLTENPGETILMMIKHENGEGSPAEIQEAIDACIGDKTGFWFTECRDPSLGEVRGKIVLARRYGEGEDGLPGLDFCWETQSGAQVQPEPCAEHDAGNGITLWVQDRYEYEREDKWNAISQCLENGHDGFRLNYLSTKGSGMAGMPCRYASVLNRRFMEAELTPGQSVGMLFFDFLTPELAARIYAQNSLED